MKSWRQRIVMTLIVGSVLIMPVNVVGREQEDLGFSSAFSDNMVLQQGKPLCLFGWGTSGDGVQVSLDQDSMRLAEASALADASGKWEVILPAQEPSFVPCTVTARSGGRKAMLKNVLIGEVWICGGQSNMQLQVQESYEAAQREKGERHSYIRLFRQEGGCDPNRAWDEPQGAWETAEDWQTVKSCSAVAYSFAEKLAAELDSPVGIVIAAVGGTSIATWLSRDIVEDHPAYLDLLEQNGLAWDPQVWATAYAYYNTFIEPFRGFRAAGILWYQGEADAQRSTVLEDGIPLLAACWSEVFQPERGFVPMLAVQIAPLDYPDNGCALANEAIAKGIAAVSQRGGRAATFPIYDIGLEYGDHPIHPLRKKPVGERAALYALHLVYGWEGLTGGPVPVQTVVRDGRAFITFSNIGEGLRLREGNRLKGCVVSYRKGSYVQVKGEITDDSTIAIELREGETPLEVGYGFYGEHGDANLINAEGIPPLIFRMKVETAEDMPPEAPSAQTETTAAGTPASRLSLLCCLGVAALAAAGISLGLFWRWYRKRTWKNSGR